jgi:hypothetical protein
MAPDDHDNHGDHQPQAQTVTPPPLLDNARATIYLDGLIYAAYNENRRVLEAAVLTQAEHHQLDIEVRLRGNEEPLFPTVQRPWNPAHGAIGVAAPFWLYVDSGNGIQENEFSAKLHSDNDDRTFNNIFNFEDHHRKTLPLVPGKFAVFNFPHGTAYSADTTKAELRIIPANEPVANAIAKGEIPVANLVGIDIDAVSNGAEKKSIVLANEDDEFFRFELEPGKQYEIKILNQPSPNSAPAAGDHEGHFLQFYELFDFDPATNQRFLVVEAEHAHGSGSSGNAGGEPAAGGPTPDNPPCAPVRSGGTGGLGGS